MIRMTLMGIRWGLDPVIEQDGEGNEVPAIQLNLLDEHSGILVNVPFNLQSATALVEQMIPFLPQEAKEQLAPLFRSGIVTATADDLRRAIDPTQGRGPQG